MGVSGRQWGRPKPGGLMIDAQEMAEELGVSIKGLGRIIRSSPDFPVAHDQTRAQKRWMRDDFIEWLRKHTRRSGAA